MLGSAHQSFITENGGSIDFCEGQGLSFQLLSARGPPFRRRVDREPWGTQRSPVPMNRACRDEGLRERTSRDPRRLIRRGRSGQWHRCQGRQERSAAGVGIRVAPRTHDQRIVLNRRIRDGGRETNDTTPNPPRVLRAGSRALCRPDRRATPSEPCSQHAQAPEFTGIIDVSFLGFHHRIAATSEVPPEEPSGGSSLDR